MTHSHISKPNRSQRLMSRGRRGALLASVIVTGGVMAASAAIASSGATLTVHDTGGKAAELLHRLTIPQLASVLKTTPAQLTLQTEAPNVQVGLELGEVLTNPNATLQEVLNLLAAHGVSTAPLEAFINHHLAGVSGTADQLRTTLNEVLADVGEDGQIAALANELGLPPAAVEAVHLTSGNAEQAASTLNTTVSRLSSVLQGAGALTQPLGSTTPVATNTVERTAENGTTALVGVPSGSGGLSLTTINSTSTAPAAAAASGAPISNAFSIVSIKVGKGGVIVETVQLPGPGQVAIKATTAKKVAVKSGNGRRRSFTRQATIASAASAVSGGLRVLTLRPKTAGLAKRFRVQLATTYTPTGGSPNTLQRSVTVSRTVRSRHR
jgi:hypothetical protein